MKRHGLWAFHYEVKEALNYTKRHELRWWHDLERQKIRDLIACRHAGWGSSLMHSNADLIMLCAARYIRRFAIRCVNLRQWVEICNRIATRAGMTHHMTVRKFSLQNFSGPRYRNPRIDIQILGSVGSQRHVWVEPKWYAAELERRALRIGNLRKARLEADAQARLERAMRLVGPVVEHPELDPRYACSYCGGPITNPRFNPDRYHRHDQHCSRHACREIAWLSHVSIGQGGVRPTRPQWQAFHPELHNVVRVLNYLQLKATQAKRRERDVRNQTS